MNETESRELFRIAMRKIYPTYSLAMEEESGDYVYMKTQKLWWLWRAARGES